MKHIVNTFIRSMTVTALAVAALMTITNVHAQQKGPFTPSTEFTAVWDPINNTWKDTTQTFRFEWGANLSLISENALFRTTYTGFVPLESKSYGSRFYWDPQKTYSRVQIDTLLEGGGTRPVRLDSYDQSIPRRTEYTRSSWNGTEWIMVQRSVTMTDTLGVISSQVNHVFTGTSLTLYDSTHVMVRQDMKGYVTGVKVQYWSATDPTLKTIAEQNYTLGGDGSIASAEIWNTQTGELARAYRLRDIDWVDFNTTFNYVPTDQGVDLFYGGNSYRSAIIDLYTGTDWSEFANLTQNFDTERRVISYIYNGMTRDTFSFNPDGTILLNQYDDGFSTNWITARGTRTVQEYDANDRLRSVIFQRYNLNTSSYVNERLYYYQYGAASVGREGSNKDVVSVYPNPAANEIRIESTSDVISVTVRDMTGRIVLSGTTRSHDITMLPAGAYSVSIATREGVSIHKIIKSE